MAIGASCTVVPSTISVALSVVVTVGAATAPGSVGPGVTSRVCTSHRVTIANVSSGASDRWGSSINSV